MLEISDNLLSTQSQIKQIFTIVQSDMLMQSNFENTLDGNTTKLFPSSTLSNLISVDKNFTNCLVRIKQKNIELKREEMQPQSTELKSFREQYSLSEEEKRKLAIHAKETAERFENEKPETNLSQEQYTH